MTKFLPEAALQVLILVPFAILLAKEKKPGNYLRILAVPFIYVVYQMLLVLPRFIPALDFIESDWNWEGKLLGILFGIVCYILCRKHFRENDFFTFRQYGPNIKKTVIVAAIVVVAMSVIYYFMDSSAFDCETLAFQLTMPALDEEIIFRGILLGLLATALKDRVSVFGSPAVWFTAVLFGLMHALTLDKNYAPGFEPVYFIHTAVGGYVFGWLTVQSRSILLAVLCHGLTNFFAALATMI